MSIDPPGRADRWNETLILAQGYLPIPYPFLGIENEFDRLQVGPCYFGPAHEGISSDLSPSLSAASRFSRRHRFITPSFLSMADLFKGPRYHPFPGAWI